MWDDAQPSQGLIRKDQALYLLVSSALWGIALHKVFAGNSSFPHYCKLFCKVSWCPLNICSSNITDAFYLIFNFHGFKSSGTYTTATHFAHVESKLWLDCGFLIPWFILQALFTGTEPWNWANSYYCGKFTHTISEKIFPPLLSYYQIKLTSLYLAYLQWLSLACTARMHCEC